MHADNTNWKLPKLVKNVDSCHKLIVELKKFMKCLQGTTELLSLEEIIS